MLLKYNKVTMRICKFLLSALLVSVFPSSHWAWAAEKTELPLWYSYSLSGKQAYEAKNYPESERFYMNSLAELEKLAAKKQRIQLPTVHGFPGNEQMALETLYGDIDRPFMKEYHAQLNEEGKQLNKEFANLPADIARAFADPSYARKKQQSISEENAKQSQKHSSYKRDQLERTRRILAVYEVLLGPNSIPARFCRERYQTEQTDLAKSAGDAQGSARLKTPDPKRAQEGPWRDLKHQALRTKNHEEIARLYELAVKEAEKFGANDTRLAESLCDLADQEYIYLKRYQKAEEHYKRALGIYEIALGKNDTKVWEVLERLGPLYGEMNRKDDERKTMARMKAMEK